MKNVTRKVKGAKFEKFIVEELKELDEKTYRVFGSGAGLEKADIRCPQLNWGLEAKNHKNLVIVDWIEQMKRQDNDANISMLVFKHPKSPDINPEPYIVLSLYDLFEITRQNANISHTEEIKDDRELSYKLNNVKTAVNQLLKYIKKD